MESQVIAALIAAGMALVVASVSALVAVWSAVISSRSQLRVARLTDELERDRKREDREAEDLQGF